MSSDPLRSAKREFRERPIELLRSTVSTLCHFIWHKELRPGEHLWSIPVDKERDFDCILSDAITELEQLRALASASASPLPENLRELLNDAFECGHMAWPSPDLPTRAAMRDHAVRTILLRAALPASASTHAKGEESSAKAMETLQIEVETLRTLLAAWQKRACEAERTNPHGEPVDPALMEPYYREMREKTIPAIIEAVRARQRAAAEAPIRILNSARPASLEEPQQP